MILLLLLGLSGLLVSSGLQKSPATVHGVRVYFYDVEEDRLRPAMGYIAAHVHEGEVYNVRSALSRSNLAHLHVSFEISEWHPPVPLYSWPITVSARSVIQVKQPPTPSLPLQNASTVMWIPTPLPVGKSSVPAQWEQTVQALEGSTIEQFVGGQHGEPWISRALLEAAYRNALTTGAPVRRVLPAAILLDLVVALVPVALVISAKWFADCVIARRRAMHNRCPACDYPYPDSATRCPECGANRINS